MDSKRVVAAGGGLTVALVMWMLATITSNHNDTSKALSDIRERLARMEARLDYRLGKATEEEIVAADVAANAEKLTEPRP